MSRYIVFYDYTLNGKLDECIGGDNYIKFDQRYSNETAINKVLSKKIVRPSQAIGFKIHSGTILNSKPITNLIKL